MKAALDIDLKCLVPCVNIVLEHRDWPIEIGSIIDENMRLPESGFDSLKCFLDLISINNVCLN